MAPSRRRNVVADDSDESEVERTQNARQEGSDEDEDEDVAPPRRGQPAAASDDSDSNPDVDADASGDFEGEGARTQSQGGEGSLEQLVKKFVRYALACEYARMPIRREGVRDKAFGKHRIPFKKVFDATQQQLRTKFGMEMQELPTKEKTSLKDRRAAAAQKSQAHSQGKSLTSTATTSNTWILTSILPSEYRMPEIISPSNILTQTAEAAYTGLYTLIISLITLNGGTLADAKLERYLNRMNAALHMLPNEGGTGGTTEAVLQKMVRQGYITRTREVVGGEESIEWGIGGRGKVEVGKAGVGGLVRAVYGLNNEEEQESEENREIEERLGRSLGLIEMSANSQRKRQSQQDDEAGGDGNGEATQENVANTKRRRGKPKKSADENEDDEDAEYAH